MAAAPIFPPYWDPDRARSVAATTTPAGGHFNYTKAQYVQDITALFQSQSLEQARERLEQMASSFHRQTIKSICTYLIAKVNSGDLPVTNSNSVQTFHLRTLEKSGLLQDTVNEGSGFNFHVALDVKWACNELVKQSSKDAYKWIKAKTPIGLWNCVADACSFIAHQAPPTVQQAGSAATDWVSKNPAVIAAGGATVTTVAAVVTAPFSALVGGAAGLVAYAHYKILG